ncbi:MAG TPA: hypothetical protein P5154_00985 [Candidatus Izemoplasmatales bacterium]|nr:hypothetical protein [Bacillota bacterium]HRY77322.1 hypothetical protein [Candidatus Izemoplasmatales bacterium]
MRERNVFGKRISRVNFVMVLLVLFLVVIGVRFGMVAILDAKLAELQAQQTDLNRRIASIVNASQTSTYHELGEIIDELPTEFDQLGIANDLSIARGIAGFASSDYQEGIENNSDNPFSAALPNRLKTVRVTISMTVDDETKIPDYLDALADLDRIFHVAAVNADVLDVGARLSLTLYTFYYDGNPS